LELKHRNLKQHNEEYLQLELEEIKGIAFEDRGKAKRIQEICTFGVLVVMVFVSFFKLDFHDFQGPGRATNLAFENSWFFIYIVCKLHPNDFGFLRGQLYIYINYIHVVYNTTIVSFHLFRLDRNLRLSQRLVSITFIGLGMFSLLAGTFLS